MQAVRRSLRKQRLRARVLSLRFLHGGSVTPSPSQALRTPALGCMRRGSVSLAPEPHPDGPRLRGPRAVVVAERASFEPEGAHLVSGGNPKHGATGGALVDLRL